MKEAKELAKKLRDSGLFGDEWGECIIYALENVACDEDDMQCLRKEIADYCAITIGKLQSIRSGLTREALLTKNSI